LTPTGWPFILLEAMWGYAQGNATIVGIVVLIIGAAAIVYVARRLWRRGR
jgi:high-affinity Fe2+/Pb2+ permease